MAIILPHLTMATFCERVLTEQDGVLTAVRLIDTLNVQVLDSDLAKGAKERVTLLVGLRSGQFKGTGTLKLVVVNPDGKPSKNASTTPVELLGGQHGANIIVSLAINVSKSGVYWYEIYFNDKLLTRTPLSVSVIEKQSELPPVTKSRPKKAKAKSS